MGVCIVLQSQPFIFHSFGISRAIAMVGTRGGRSHLPNASAPPPVLALQFTRAPTVGSMNVFSDNYLDKLSPASLVLLDQVLVDAVVW